MQGPWGRPPSPRLKPRYPKAQTLRLNMKPRYPKALTLRLNIFLDPRWYLAALGKVVNHPGEKVKTLEVHLKQRLLLLGGNSTDLKGEGSMLNAAWSP